MAVGNLKLEGKGTSLLLDRRSRRGAREQIPLRMPALRSFYQHSTKARAPLSEGIIPNI